LRKKLSGLEIPDVSSSSEHDWNKREAEKSVAYNMFLIFIVLMILLV